MAYNTLKSWQIKHDEEFLSDILNKNQEQSLIIEALKNLLLMKGILTEKEIEDCINSIKVMDKLTEG